MKDIRITVLPEDNTTIEIRDASCGCFITRITNVRSIGWGNGIETHTIILKE